jgi:hypothetical protein
VAEARDITSLNLEELAEVERLESELDAFITKRAEQAKDAEHEDDLWAKRAARERRRRREENRTLWVEYHNRLSRSHARISAEHQEKAQALLEQSEEKDGEIMNPNKNGRGEAIATEGGGGSG